MKKIKSVAIEAGLLEEAEREAVKRGITFSALVEEALRLYLRIGIKNIEEKLAVLEVAVKQCLEKTEKTSEPPKREPLSTPGSTS